MARVKNLTGDTLGWNGVQIGPYGEIEMPDDVVCRMVESNPGKFRAIDSRYETVAQSEAEVATSSHRHVWRKGTVCTCGAIRTVRNRD